MALICVYFIEGGALSSNTVLIAFEGFNFFNQYVFLPICMTFKGFITFLVNYYDTVVLALNRISALVSVFPLKMLIFSLN